MQVQVCGGQVTWEGPWEAMQSLLQSRPLGQDAPVPPWARRLCVCVWGGVFPVTLACSPAHSWPEKALGRYRQGEGKAAGPQEMPWRGHSQEYPEVGEQAMVTDWRGWPRGVQSLWAAELPGEGSLPQGRASTGRLASPGPSAEPQLGRGFSPERGPYVGGGVMMAATRGARARPEHQGGQEP